MANLDFFSQLTTQTSSSASQNLLASFIGGNMGGIGTVISGHPLDTVRIRMQILNLKFFECCRVIIQREGFSAFFKGMSSPLVTAPVIYSFYMSAYDAAKMYQGVRFEDQMTVFQTFIAGMFAGVAYSSLGTPVELIKSRRQMEISPEAGKSSTVRHMIRDIVKKEGLRGLYRGHLMVVLREVPGSGTYFVSYEYARMKLNNLFGKNSMNSLFAGAFAGLVFNVVTYPFDAVKMTLQVSDRSMYPRHKWIKDGGIVSCVKQMYKADGFKAFWRGLKPSAIRSMIIEGTHFFLYDKTKNYFAGESEKWGN